MIFDLEMIRNVHHKMPEKLNHARSILKKPLTLTEKILYTHMSNDLTEGAQRGKSYVLFSPDRVAMQDATAQMALLQFMCAKKEKTAVPSTVHCDHLIQAEIGAKEDLKRANNESHEVFDFLKSVSQKYGLGFWKPGSGIIHQIILENYAFPGALMIGTDSHTPNAGGLGMIAVGVGGADAVDVMAGMPWELKFPKVIGVKLTGKMQGWTSPKDVILKLAGILTVKGGTGAIIEYFGEGTETISCTGKGTICNMGAEIGATTSLFPYDSRMSDYLKITSREEVAQSADQIQDCLKADPEVLEDPEKFYDQVIEIDLTSLEPHINGPFTPDKAWPISKFAEAVKNNNYPDELKVALIGSCTNSSYEDIERVTSIARFAKANQLNTKSKLMITPGSEQIRATIDRDGHLKVLEEIGGLVLANACGPCIGQWKRHDVKMGEKNSILTSYNRNFSKRNDANPETHSFVTSPEIVMAMALAGTLSFNPLKDSLKNEEGKDVKLEAPSGKELPPNGFDPGEDCFIAPVKEAFSLEVKIDESSERLQLLTPFNARKATDFQKMPVLMKAKGKCTTDHISPAGKWLRFRGHLDRISDNMFIGAVNAFREEIGKGLNVFTNAVDSFSKVARAYKEKKATWIAVGDENYGEGSSREHAAMEPRFLGSGVILVKSFARIHETNLKKQGMLAITFENPSDYDKIQEEDRLSITDLEQFAPGKSLTVLIEHKEGSTEEIKVNHTYGQNQIDWFWAGSALNLIAKAH
ncbi:MAG: 2-methylcitrate dehydratase (2-methyl-trans-aconitate forming) [Chlamydiae bacterium]|nr:2-methylcitrate dehydratase (2-methyl-trans-aconitate forming) [Chlamydiota bacterium]